MKTFPFLNYFGNEIPRRIFSSLGKDAGGSCANSCFFEKMMLSIFSNVTEFARLRTGAALIVGIEAPQIREILEPLETLEPPAILSLEGNPA